ncbi:FAD-dependent oxidoreductase [Methylobacterium sp. J-030]|nr:FAD-dependent oxidoreductase [Methylobacterium sp. J-030]
MRLATPAERIDLTADGVAVTTRAGTVRAKAAVLTVSTAVLAGDAICLPPGTEPWREAAAALPLGRNEKVFLEIGRDAAFEPGSHAYGNLRDARSAAYSIRPNGRPVIEAFLGGDGARILEMEGPAAGFAHATTELVALFGSDLASALRSLAATAWCRMASIGGAYSCAPPGQSQTRARLARPFEDRLFFAGEAAHPFDFKRLMGLMTAGTGPRTRSWQRFGTDGGKRHDGSPAASVWSQAPEDPRLTSDALGHHRTTSALNTLLRWKSVRHGSPKTDASDPRLRMQTPRPRSTRSRRSTTNRRQASGLACGGPSYKLGAIGVSHVRSSARRAVLVAQAGLPSTLA